MDLLDVLILALRVALVVLLYVFVAFVVRGAVRALRAPATREPAPQQPKQPGTGLRLLVIEPGAAELHAGQVVDVDDGVILGRAEGAGLVLADPAVSAEHARLARVDGAWVVMDLGSTNGTLLNQRAVDGQATLQAGDVLGLGNVRLKIVGY